MCYLCFKPTLLFNAVVLVLFKWSARVPVFVEHQYVLRISLKVTTAKTFMQLRERGKGVFEVLAEGTEHNYTTQIVFNTHTTKMVSGFLLAHSQSLLN